MKNIDRLQMEITEEIFNNYTTDQLTILLQENSLNADSDYNSESKTNKKNILKTALSILEAIANWS